MDGARACRRQQLRCVVVSARIAVAGWRCVALPQQQGRMPRRWLRWWQPKRGACWPEPGRAGPGRLRIRCRNSCRRCRRRRCPSRRFPACLSVPGIYGQQAPGERTTDRRQAARSAPARSRGGRRLYAGARVS